MAPLDRMGETRDLGDVEVVEVNGIKWVTGLRWDTRDSAVTRAVARAETTARGDSHFVLRPDTQFATVASTAGVKTKMPSLGTALAETSQGNVLGAFRLPDDKYYVFALRDEKIQPGFDNVYPIREAQSRFEQLFSEANWTTRYAPDDWGYSDALPRTLTEVTPVRPPPASRLREPSRVGDALRLLPVAAVLLLAFIGYEGYQYYQQRQEEVRLQQAARLAREQKARLDKLNKVIWPQMPTTETKRGVQLAEACISFMTDSIPYHLPGWDSSKATCDGQTVSVEMDQETGFGTVNWVAPTVRERYGTPQIVISAAAHRATLTWPLKTAMTQSWGAIDGQAPERVTNYINSQFGEIYQEAKVDPPTRPTITVKTVGGRTVPATAPWSIMGATVESVGRVPEPYIAIMQRIQNTRLVHVERNFRDDKWTMKFEIYHAEPPIQPRVD